MGVCGWWCGFLVTNFDARGKEIWSPVDFSALRTDEDASFLNYLHDDGVCDIKLLMPAMAAVNETTLLLKGATATRSTYQGIVQCFSSFPKQAEALLLLSVSGCKRENKG